MNYIIPKREMEGSALILKNKARILSFSSALFLFLFSFFFSSACRLYNLERKLDPINAEFLSKVRLIITKEERKIFLELPDSEKEKFKEEFWKRRDPDPATEENEFKMEYLNRVEEADRIFVSETKPGYLTDRGRIYVLFGPPSFRETYPIENSDPTSVLYRRCGEIWHYSGFPIVFLDSTCTGDYRLVTYDLTPIRELNLIYLHELNLAQARAQKTFEIEKEFFDFNWRVSKTIDEAERFEGIIIIEVPYRAIWYSFEEEMLKTTLDLSLELKDSKSGLIWSYKGAFEISMKEEELKERKDKMFKMEIPIILEKELDRLSEGKNLLQATLKNRTGEEEAKKVMEFKRDLSL